MSIQSFLSSKSFHIFLGFLVSAVLVLWLAQAIEWSIVLEQSTRIRPLMLIPFCLCLALHFFLRALRWRYLLENGAAVPLRLLFDALMVGNFATYVLPLRAGEFIRPYMLTKKAPVPIAFPTSFTSVVIERFFDLLVVLSTFALVILFLPDLPPWVHSGAYGLSLLGIAIFVFIILGILIPKQLLQLMSFFLTPAPAPVKNFFLRTAENFIAGAIVLKNLKNLFATLILSLLVWLSNYLFIYVSLHLLPLDNSILLAVTVAVIMALAVAAPSAPGFIGVIQVSCIVSFALFDLSKELATAYAVLAHSLQYICIVSYGLYALSYNGFTLRQLREKRPQPEPSL